MSLIVLIAIVRGKKALSIFPPISEDQVIFREKRVSGGSLDSWRSRAGGSRKALEVIVTTKELWIKPILIVAGFSSIFDSIHKIKLGDIQNTETRGKAVVVTFYSQSAEVKKVSLILRDPSLFLGAIRQ